MQRASRNRTGARVLVLAAAFTALLMSVQATPALAAPSCISVADLAVDLVLSPGESATTIRTFEIHDGAENLVSGEPIVDGALGPHLSSQVAWCAGVGCTPDTVLEVGASQPLKPGMVTVAFTVTLDASAPAGTAAGSIHQNHQVAGIGGPGCIVTSTDDSARPGLDNTGRSLAEASAWGVALLGVGSLLWGVAAKRRREAEESGQ